MASRCSCSSRYFNSRTHVECDTNSGIIKRREINFNSRTHVECDSFRSFFFAPNAAFQLTHSRGVRPENRFQISPHIRFQLTHSRGVRLPGCRSHTAPVDFNSRTHVECDESGLAIAVTDQHFNSRTHVECDKSQGLVDGALQISTHALTWSATTGLKATGQSLLFQLTHSRGVRLGLACWVCSSCKFQLTHSRGVRPRSRI